MNRVDVPFAVAAGHEPSLQSLELTKDGEFVPGDDDRIARGLLLIDMHMGNVGPCNFLSVYSLATMSTTATTTVTESSGTLKLRGDEKKQREYRWTHLLPAFPKDEHYPPLTPFEHVDPGHRALQHPDPRLFLRDAKVTQLTPPIGEEIRGINLATLTDDEKDELALEVRTIAIASFPHPLPN